MDPVDTRADVHLYRVFDALPDSTAIVGPSGDIVAVNRAWERFGEFNGAPPPGIGVGADYLGICEAAALRGDADAAVVGRGLLAVLSGARTGFTWEYPCASPDEDRWFVVRITALGGSSGALVSHLDITRRRLTEDRLSHAAAHDSLTALPNREQVLTRLEQELDRAGEPGEAVSVLFVDLDDFKSVNDRLGHDAGDAVLVTVGNRLERLLRSGDVIGRIGGDEFLIVSRTDDAQALVGRIRRAVAIPVLVGGDVAVVGASIGVATSSECADRPTAAAADELRALADARMYRDKRRRQAAR